MSCRGALRLGLGAAFTAFLLVVACGKADHPPPFQIGGAGGPAVDGGIRFDAPLSDGPPTCGGESIRALVDVPKIYFVLDRSGSMSEDIDESGVSKYQAAWHAVAALLRVIGHRIEYGAALFPAEGDFECGGGRQIFPTTLGDPVSAAGVGENGPILQSLLSRFANYEPFGGTPTSAALDELGPTIEGLGGRTYVVLATDGAPNCNPDAVCDSSGCIPDIERMPSGADICGVGFSCCDPVAVGVGAGANCIDRDATVAAVAELTTAGIPTYVIGMPGSETYASVLGAMAEAGGTARPGKTPYYAVTDDQALSNALLEIGTGIAIGCDLGLESVPPNANLVNIYFDGEVVPSDPEQGWDWTGDASVSLRGEACDTLRSGAVRDVQIVYGCVTVVR